MGTDGTAWAEGPGPDGNARVLVGRYRLEGRLGRGGMGVVWRATDRLLGRQVAVKELSLDEGGALTADEAAQRRERTLREARALAQLGHPHIIGVHDVIEADGRPYIVMELVDGPTLAELISQSGPVDAREAARIGIALLSALRKAHASGVLHRDLKPANVLLETDTGRVVLTDFGIARVTGATTLTESGSFLGSPEYTAPERMSGARTGPESDLWSLGALLCAAVSGTSPFSRDSLSAVLLAVVSDEIRVPAQARPLLPVIRGLLERDPERRLDAAEAEQMLRAYAETGRVPPLPPGAGPPGARGAARARRAPLGARLSHLPLSHRLKGMGGGTAGTPTASSPTPRTLRRPHRSSRRGTPRPGPSDQPPGETGDTGAGRGDPPEAQKSPGVPEQREPSDHTFAAQERPTAVAHPATAESARRPPATGGRQLPSTPGPEPHPPATPWSPDATGPWPPAEAEPWSTASTEPEQAPAGRLPERAPSERLPSERTSPGRTPPEPAPDAGASNGSGDSGDSDDSGDSGPKGAAAPAGAPRDTDAHRPPSPLPPSPPPAPGRTVRTVLVTTALVAAVAGTGVSAIALLVHGDGHGRHTSKTSAPASPASSASPTSSASHSSASPTSSVIPTSSASFANPAGSPTPTSSPAPTSSPNLTGSANKTNTASRAVHSSTPSVSPVRPDSGAVPPAAPPPAGASAPVPSASS